MNILKNIKGRILLLLIIFMGAMGVSTELNDFEIAKNIEIFSNIFKELNTYYPDEVDPEKLMEVATNRMLHSLDPYTTYIPADEVGSFQSSISGKYAGIGATIFKGKDYVVVSMPYENSPAQKAGLLAGDKVIEIDGKDMKGKTPKEISHFMRGAPNTSVTFKIKRYGHDKPIKITVEREEIKVSNTPYYGMIDGNIAYIALTTFSRGAGENVANALEELKGNNVVDGVVLDLRGNTGGLLAEAINVANVFIDEDQKIVQTKGRDKSRYQIYTTQKPAVDTEIPLAIMIDGSSASASEIVAGAVQDLDRGVIIGQRSYGKGLVQNTRNLSYGAKLKITTARYYIPSGRCIQSLAYEDGKPKQIADSLRVAHKTKGGRKVLDGGGIKPDVVIENKLYDKILRKLRKKQYLFNFATKYRNENSKVAPVETFEIDDKVVDSFMQFLEEEGFEYETATQRAAKQFAEKVKQEDLNDLLADDIAEVRAKIDGQGMEEMMVQKDFLRNDLQRQIAAAYYYRKGAIIAGIKNDPKIQQAKQVLVSEKKYNQILSPSK